MQILGVYIKIIIFLLFIIKMTPMFFFEDLYINPLIIQKRTVLNAFEMKTDIFIITGVLLSFI